MAIFVISMISLLIENENFALLSGGISHVSPAKSFMQIHSTFPFLLVHVPLFSQGIGWQGSSEITST